MKAMKRPRYTEYELFGTDSDAEPDDKDKVKKEDEKEAAAAMLELDAERTKKKNKGQNSSLGRAVIRRAADDRRKQHERLNAKYVSPEKRAGRAVLTCAAAVPTEPGSRLQTWKLRTGSPASRR